MRPSEAGATSVADHPMSAALLSSRKIHTNLASLARGSKVRSLVAAEEAELHFGAVAAPAAEAPDAPLVGTDPRGRHACDGM